MSETVVTTLHRFPIKSFGGNRITASLIGALGLEADRRWMVVDANGKCVTQRDLPELCLFRADPAQDGVVITAPDGEQRLVLFPDENAEMVSSRIWDDDLELYLADRDTNSWLSSHFSTELRLTFQPESVVRKIRLEDRQIADTVSLADGFPVLLCSEDSLAELNSRLESPIPMGRFRPNIVVSGCGPFAEDSWRQIRIGQVTFRVVKPCMRCVVINTDPESGTVGKEPLRTLASYRSAGQKVMFGQNLIPDNTGTIRVGDTVEKIEN